MSSLKSFLYGVAPIVGMSPVALYERQRALVKLGLLTVIPGRGPGSGVALSADSVAVMVICILAAETLGDVDQRVADLCSALPKARNDPEFLRWRRLGAPTFRSEVARLLCGQDIMLAADTNFRGIRVSRCWRGQIMHGRGKAWRSADYLVDRFDHRPGGSISITAEIEDEMLGELVFFTKGALSQTEEIEEGEQ